MIRALIIASSLAVTSLFSGGVNSASSPCSCCTDCKCANCICEEAGCACDSGGTCYCDPGCCNGGQCCKSACCQK